jgi:hypothetical protein
MSAFWWVLGLLLIGLVIWGMSSPGGPEAPEPRAGDSQQVHTRSEAAGGTGAFHRWLSPGGPIEAGEPAPAGAPTPVARPVEPITVKAVYRDAQGVLAAIEVNGTPSPWLSPGEEFQQWRVVSVHDTAVVVARGAETKALKFHSTGR